MYSSGSKTKSCQEIVKALNTEHMIVWNNFKRAGGTFQYELLIKDFESKLETFNRNIISNI